MRTVDNDTELLSLVLGVCLCFENCHELSVWQQMPCLVHPVQLLLSEHQSIAAGTASEGGACCGHSALQCAFDSTRCASPHAQ